MKSRFTVVADTREQKPWDFRGMPKARGAGVMEIPVVSRCLGNKMGDYSIEGCEDKIAIERKSMDDLFGTVLSRRDGFIKELEVLSKLDYAAVVVEGSMGKMFTYDMRHWDNLENINEKWRVLQRKRVSRSIIAWQLRYPGVRWWFLPSRPAAQIWAYRLLERWWEDVNEKN